MAKFVYRMQNILDVKEKLETQAKNAYTIANAKYQEEQMLLQEMLLRRTGYERRLKDLMSGDLDIREVNAARKDLNDMKTLTRRQMVEVRKAEDILNAARIELNKIMVERKTHEKLKEKAFNEFQRDQLVAESNEIDELVSYTFNMK